MAFVMTQLTADLGHFDTALRAAQTRLTAFVSGPAGMPASVERPGGAGALVEGLAAWLKAPPLDVDAPPRSGKSRDESAVERGVRPAPAVAAIDRGALLALGAALRTELARLGTHAAGPERATMVAPDFRERGADLRQVAAVAPGGTHVRAAEHSATPPLGRPVHVFPAIGTRPEGGHDNEGRARPRLLVQHHRARWDRAARFLSELHTRESLLVRPPDAPGPLRFNPAAVTGPPPAQPRPFSATPRPERADRETGQADLAVREDLTRFLDDLLQRFDARASAVAPPRPPGQPPGPFPDTARTVPVGDPAAFAGLLREALAGNGRLVAAAEATARNTQELATLARKPPPPSPSVLVGPE